MELKRREEMILYEKPERGEDAIANGPILLAGNPFFFI